MCGRYSLALEQSREISQIVAEVQAWFWVASIHTGEVFPTNAALVLLLEEQKMIPKPMTWGFPGFKGKGVIVNARGKTVFDKSMLRRSLLERRCAVPTTGFYRVGQTKA